ncbi:MAG: hypothetical protein ABL904_00295 [Hyphomicrobiaceae bacterium]
MSSTKDGKSAPQKAREDRLADALRVNLKRRKAADRAKTAATATTTNTEPEPAG